MLSEETETTNSLPKLENNLVSPSHHLRARPLTTLYVVPYRQISSDSPLLSNSITSTLAEAKQQKPQKMLSAKESEQKRRDIERWSEEIYYSPRYSGESPCFRGQAGRQFDGNC